MSLYQFLRSRIRMGRMSNAAIPRANRLVRQLDADSRITLCRPSPDIAVGQRTGRLSAGEITFRDACAMVNMHHRHHGSPVGHLFSGGVFDGDTLCGAVIVGRPVSRHQDDGYTVEVTRVVSDGTRNACSKVMGWAIREAKRRGYRRVLTYTLAEESGASLRAVGFRAIGTSPGGSWDTPSRRRAPARHPTSAKTRWEIQIANAAPQQQGRLQFD